MWVVRGGQRFKDLRTPTSASHLSPSRLPPRLLLLRLARSTEYSSDNNGGSLGHVSPRLAEVSVPLVRYCATGLLLTR